MLDISQLDFSNAYELPSNHFWWRRSGSVNKQGDKVFLIKRGSVNRSGEHSGPSGYKLKKLRSYRNLKLRRKGYN